MRDAMLELIKAIFELYCFSRGKYQDLWRVVVGTHDIKEQEQSSQVSTSCFFFMT